MRSLPTVAEESARVLTEIVEDLHQIFYASAHDLHLSGVTSGATTPGTSPHEVAKFPASSGLVSWIVPARRDLLRGGAVLGFSVATDGTSTNVVNFDLEARGVASGASQEGSSLYSGSFTVTPSGTANDIQKVEVEVTSFAHRGDDLFCQWSLERVTDTNPDVAHLSLVEVRIYESRR